MVLTLARQPTHLLLALSEGRLSSLLLSYGIGVETVERHAPGSTTRTVDDDTVLRTIGELTHIFEHTAVNRADLRIDLQSRVRKAA